MSSEQSRYQHLQHLQHLQHIQHLQHAQQLHQHQHQRHNQHRRQLSPDRALAALPDSYMNCSTPQCHCPMQQLQHEASPGTPSSSLLSFADSSASFSSEQSQASPRAARVAESQRRRCLVRREEGQLYRLVSDLDSRLRLAGAADRDLLALRRMSAESVLRTMQAYAAAAVRADEANRACAASGTSTGTGGGVDGAVKAGDSLDADGNDGSGSVDSFSDSESCGLFDF